MQVDTQTEFSIYLMHRPGELAGVLGAAAEAGVQIDAVTVTDQNNRGLVRVLGSPEEQLRAVFESLVEAGAGPVVETPVLVVPVESRPTVLHDIAANLAVAGINVQYAYAAAAINGTPSRCILRVSDIDQARATIDAMT